MVKKGPDGPKGVPNGQKQQYVAYFEKKPNIPVLNVNVAAIYEKMSKKITVFAIFCPEWQVIGLGEVFFSQIVSEMIWWKFR